VHRSQAPPTSRKGITEGHKYQEARITVIVRAAQLPSALGLPHENIHVKACSLLPRFPLQNFHKFRVSLSKQDLDTAKTPWEQFFSNCAPVELRRLGERGVEVETQEAYHFRTIELAKFIIK
jgi:hypothetical protein